MKMALCSTSLRMFMRHSELKNVCRHMKCVSFWKRMPATPLLMTEWISRRQAYYSTDTIDDQSKQGQKTNNVKAAQSKNGTPKSSTSPSSSTTTKTTTAAVKTRKTLRAEDTKNTENASSLIDFESENDLSKDLSQMKIAQLKDKLRAHGLNVSGTKTILIERLQNYLHQQKKEQHQPQQQEQEQEQIKDPQNSYNPENESIKETTAEEINVVSCGKMTTAAVDTNNQILPKSKTSLSYHPSTAYPISHAMAAPSNCSNIGHTVSETDTITVATVTDINHSMIRAASAADSNQKHGDVSIEYIQGLPHFTIPLPSRNEKCQFALKPVTHQVGDLINMLRIEDRGIDRAVVLNEAGIRVSSTCNIESLLDAPFWLHINDKKYKIIPPKRDRIDFGDINKLGDIRVLVAQLYEALNVGEYHIQKENEMTSKLEDLKYKVAPLERKFEELNTQASRKTSSLMWVGLGFMSVQFGVIARLTWWEYSWDIMEPVTYFVTYGTTMAMFAYFCITKTEYNMPEVKERQYLLEIHKKAKRANFDIDGYNILKRQIAEIEYNLRRLRDPLNMQLPPHVDRSQEHKPPVTPPETTTSSTTTTPETLSSSSSSSSEPSLLATRHSKDGK